MAAFVVASWRRRRGIVAASSCRGIVAASSTSPRSPPQVTQALCATAEGFFDAVAALRAAGFVEAVSYDGGARFDRPDRRFTAGVALPAVVKRRDWTDGGRPVWKLRDDGTEGRAAKKADLPEAERGADKAAWVARQRRYVLANASFDHFTAARAALDADDRGAAGRLFARATTDAADAFRRAAKIHGGPLALSRWPLHRTPLPPPEETSEVLRRYTSASGERRFDENVAADLPPEALYPTPGAFSAAVAAVDLVHGAAAACHLRGLVDAAAKAEDRAAGPPDRDRASVLLRGYVDAAPREALRALGAADVAGVPDDLAAMLEGEETGAALDDAVLAMASEAAALLDATRRPRHAWLARFNAKARLAAVVRLGVGLAEKRKDWEQAMAWLERARRPSGDGVYWSWLCHVRREDDAVFQRCESYRYASAESRRRRDRDVDPRRRVAATPRPGRRRSV